MRLTNIQRLQEQHKAHTCQPQSQRHICPRCIVLKASMESSGNSATGSPYITQANPQPISKPGNATYIFRTQWHLFLPPVYKGRAGQLHYEMPCSGIALDVAYTAKTQVRSWSSYTCISSENRKRWRRKILRAQENAPHIRPSLFWKYEFRRDCLCVGLSLSLSLSGSVSLPLSL